MQRLAYQSEARVYNDWAIPPLVKTIEKLEVEFEMNRIFRALSGQMLIGSVRAAHKEETCSIGRLVVHPNYHRRGLGSRLMSKIEEMFPLARRFELFTGSRSESNIQLYEKLDCQLFRTEMLSPDVTLVYMEKKNES